MTFFLGLFGVVISLPLFLIFEELNSLVPSTVDGLLLRLGLFSGFCAVASINLALKMEMAGLVALIRSCDVIFAFLLQYVFLDEAPDLLR
jgi:drug/metabolite transporter (DMT)-like permease